MIGRSDEVSILQALYDTEHAEFLAIYGRRRVGKTYLIRSFFAEQECVFFNVTGTKSAPFTTQKKHFTQRIGEIFFHGVEPKAGATWDDTFALLHQAIKSIAPDKKIILFLDELPWMATPRSRLLETIDYYWNQYWSMDKRVKLIICGSFASWIIKNIIQDRGGLHNRITREIHLKPLSLSQTRHFLQQRGVHLNDNHIVQLYFMMGGVPFYLTKVSPGLSAQQIMSSLLHGPQSFLIGEFDKLFTSLFDNAADYVNLVRHLAQKQEGMGERQLLAALGKHAVGAKGKKILNDLEHTGFIMSFLPLYRKRQGRFYRLTDEYTLFYLRWIEPIKTALQQGTIAQEYWQHIQSTPAWKSWQGYAFESVCHKHVNKIRQALKLSPLDMSGTWRYTPKPSSPMRGAQIDLLFDRCDDAISLCEIKYSQKPFTISKDYGEILQQKQAVFHTHTHTTKHLFWVLIAAHGVADNEHARALISQVVTIKDLF